VANGRARVFVLVSAFRFTFIVIPAQAGIQCPARDAASGRCLVPPLVGPLRPPWIPACAGMTVRMTFCPSRRRARRTIDPKVSKTAPVAEEKIHSAFGDPEYHRASFSA
jgi:hypothetical protein